MVAIIMEDEIQTVLRDWLTDPTSETLGKSQRAIPDIIEAIFGLIEEWKSNRELVSALCLRLFGYYRSDSSESKVFALQFVPSLIYSYLSAIAQGDRKDVGSVQTLLVALYNLEAGGPEAQSPRTHSFRVPNVAQPSIYHDTSALATSSLTETALRRLDPANRISVKFGPHPHIQGFNAENRLPALAALLRVYSHHLSAYPRSSLTESCMAFRRLVAQGYTRHSEGSPRIPLSSQILVEMLHILYSLTPLPVSNGETFVRLHSPLPDESGSISVEEGDLGSAARQTLEAVQRRAEVELIAAPLLVSAALSDSSHLSIKGVSGSPQLVSAGGSGGGTARAMWKSMITNASFRTKKLPDDITVSQVAEAEAAAAAASATPHHHQSSNSPALGSITEEAGTPDGEPTGLGAGLKQFRLSELVKKKNKTKPSKSSSSSIKSSANNGSASMVVTESETNGSILTNNSSDGESGGKEETELRRRSGELATNTTTTTTSNGSTAV